MTAPPCSLPAAAGLRALLAAALMAAVAGVTPARQVQVEEIVRSEIEVERSTRLPPRTVATLSEAGAIYADGDSEAAVPLLQEVIGTLETLAAEAGSAARLAAEDPRLFDTLQTAWLYLAAARWTLDDREGTDEALDRIIRLDPLFELDPATAGTQLTERLERRREELVGGVSFVVAPWDAEILVAGAAFENAAPPPEPPPDAVRENAGSPDAENESNDGEDAQDAAAAEDGPDSEASGDDADEDAFEPPPPTPILAGDYLVQVTRPGYLPTTAAFAIAGGSDQEVAVELERDSAVVRLRTAPTGATVRVDGIERGQTRGQAEPWYEPDGAAASHPPEDFSRELWLDDLPAGRYRIEVEKDGFRQFRTSLQLPDLQDYVLPPVVLEREEGVVGLVGLTRDATVLGNGRILRPDFSVSPPQVRLPPGAWDLSITHGTLGHFETSVVAEDRRRIDIDVDLRPALVFLGALGEDPGGLRAVGAALDAFRAGDTWTVLDRRAGGEAALAALGLDAATLRDRRAALGMNWATVQRQVQSALPGALYVVAVLNDDLVADAVDFWLWPAAPSPPTPDVRTLGIGDRRLEAGTLQALTTALDPDLGLRTPRFGAVLVDSLASSGPVVATVEPGGPAAEAGLVPGMEVTTIAGEPATAAGLTAAMANLGPGEFIEIATRNGGVSVHLVEPEWGFSLQDAFGEEMLPAATAARLQQELGRAGDVPRWLLELDLATLLLNGGDAAEAVRQLRAIEAPSRRGLGRDTVQYLLAMALATLADEGRDQYRERARAIFEELAETERGRLGADAGPDLAPRARLHARGLAVDR